MIPALPADAMVAGTYRVLRRLGTGNGVSALYAAEVAATWRPCALRVFDPAVAGTDTARARFEAACRVRAKVRSPHVVDLLAAGVDAGTPWMALEWLEGSSLLELLGSWGDQA